MNGAREVSPVGVGIASPIKLSLLTQLKDSEDTKQGTPGLAERAR